MGPSPLPSSPLPLRGAGRGETFSPFPPRFRRLLRKSKGARGVRGRTSAGREFRASFVVTFLDFSPSSEYPIKMILLVAEDSGVPSLLSGD
jgi:hypothetical protein